MRILKFGMLFICCIVWSACSTSRHVSGQNEVSIKRSAKSKKEMQSDPDASTLRFSLIDKNNGTKRNILSLIYIDDIKFKSDQEGNYEMKVLPGRHTIRINSVGYYPEKFKVKTQIEFNYDITLLWEEKSEILY